MIKFLIFVTAIAVHFAACGQSASNSALAELNKQFLHAKTDQEGDYVLDELLDFFMNFEIADSIKQRVENDVRIMVDTTNVLQSALYNRISEEQNPYEVERFLHYTIIKNAMICRARDQNDEWRLLMARAKSLANWVDKRTNNLYWSEFIDEKMNIPAEEALNWLRGLVSTNLSNKYHDQEMYYRLGEAYAALGIRYLPKSLDLRLKTEMLMRLQYTIFFFRGFNELSAHFAAYIRKNYQDTTYSLLSWGVSYHQAEANYLNGQVRDALLLFRQIKLNSDRLSLTPWSRWFRIQTRFYIANCYWQLAQYDKALQVCDEIEGFQLRPEEEYALHNTRGLVAKRMTRYQEAEFHYLRALDLVIQQKLTSNELALMHNLGLLYFELGDYDAALTYFLRYVTKLKNYNPNNSLRLANVIIDMARVYAKKGEFKSADRYMMQARGLIEESGNIPWRRADLYAALAELAIEAGRPETALANFRRAAAICEENGLVRKDLENENHIGRCLVSLSRNEEAIKFISSTIEMADELNAVEQWIDAKALLAEAYSNENRILRAINVSNDLIKKVVEIDTVLEDIDIHMAFRQRIYDYLKQMVTYEIRNHRIDSAFVKYDYAKGSSIAKELGEPDISTSGGIPFINLDDVFENMNKTQAIIDYMVTSDTLFAFILAGSDMTLFRHAIKKDSLEKDVQKLLQTIALTASGEIDLRDQGERTFELSKKISRRLLFWLPYLPEQISELYFVGDEFLHDIPWEALPVMNSDSTCYLVDMKAVAVSPSVALLLNGSQKQVSVDLSELRMLVSADPEIPGAIDFVSSLKKVFPKTDVLSTTSWPPIKSDILATLQNGYQALVFVGHGESHPSSPELSSIGLFVKKSTSSESEIVPFTLRDFRGLSLTKVKLAMLIGCETLGVKTVRGTGKVGLQQSFIGLGVQNVLASRWSIDADHALRQATFFLRDWVCSNEPLPTLQRTVLQMKKNYVLGETNSNPFFWACFALFAPLIN